MPILDDLGLGGDDDAGVMDTSAPAPASTTPFNPVKQQQAPSPEESAQQQADQQAQQVQQEYASKISNLLSSINTGVDVDAYFYDTKADKITLTRDYIEMVLQEYGQATQNMSPLQKFVQIDAKLDKALREYRVDVQSLLGNVLTSGK